VHLVEGRVYQAGELLTVPDEEVREWLAAGYVEEAK